MILQAVSYQGLGRRKLGHLRRRLPPQSMFSKILNDERVVLYHKVDISSLHTQLLHRVVYLNSLPPNLLTRLSAWCLVHPTTHIRGSFLVRFSSRSYDNGEPIQKSTITNHILNTFAHRTSQMTMQTPLTLHYP